MSSVFALLSGLVFGIGLIASGQLASSNGVDEGGEPAAG